MDTNQRAIDVYDLDAVTYIEGGDKHLSAIEKTKAYVGEGQDPFCLHVLLLLRQESVSRVYLFCILMLRSSVKKLAKESWSKENFR